MAATLHRHGLVCPTEARLSLSGPGFGVTWASRGVRAATLANAPRIESNRGDRVGRQDGANRRFTDAFSWPRTAVCWNRNGGSACA